MDIEENMSPCTPYNCNWAMKYLLYNIYNKTTLVVLEIIKESDIETLGT